MFIYYFQVVIKSEVLTVLAYKVMWIGMISISFNCAGIGSHLTQPCNAALINSLLTSDLTFILSVCFALLSSTFELVFLNL